MKFYKKPLFWAIFIFCYTIIFFRHEKVSFHDDGFGRAWYYGDNASALNVESAAKYYLDSGFHKNASLPMYEYTSSNADYVYTHYPPLAEWIGGVIAVSTGFWEAYQLSFLTLFLSMFLFFVIFRFLSDIIADDKISFLSASILVLSNYFISWADDIHQHLYIELFRWLFVYIWWKYLTTSKHRVVSIASLMLLYFAMCFLSFEPFVYIFIVIVGFAWVFQKRLFSLDVFLLVCVPVVAFTLRLYLNSLYFGGFAAMYADMHDALTHRTGGESSKSELGRKMYLSDYIYLLPKTRIHRLGHFYIFPSLMIIFFYLLGLWHLYKTNKQLFKLAFVLMVAALSWSFVMSQHALIHIFTLRHSALFIGLTIGYGLTLYWKQVVASFNQKKVLAIAIHSILITYSIVYIAINTIYFVYLKFGILYPHLGSNKYELIDHFLF